MSPSFRRSMLHRTRDVEEWWMKEFERQGLAFRSVPGSIGFKALMSKTLITEFNSKGLQSPLTETIAMYGGQNDGVAQSYSCS
jgi:hypothetical protein